MVNRYRVKLSEKRSKKGYEKIAKRNRLLQFLGKVPDHRKGQGKLHRLDHILFLSVIAQLMGATDYKQIQIWIKNHIQRDEIKKLQK